MEVDGIFSLSSNTTTSLEDHQDHHLKPSTQCHRQRRKTHSNQKLKEEEEDDAAHSSAQKIITAVTFVSPFTQAVCSPDITAKTTGAALSALHKFILYGFIGGHQDVTGSSGLSTNCNNGSSIGLPNYSHGGDEFEGG